VGPIRGKDGMANGKIMDAKQLAGNLVDADWYMVESRKK